MENPKTLYPRYFTFFVTNQCNASCVHCFCGDLKNAAFPEISLPIINKILHSLKHSTSLTLTGGEPFLREDFSELLELVLDNPNIDFVNCATNGFLSSKIYSTLSRVLSETSTPLHLQISLDGLPLVHNKIRGRESSYEMALVTILKAIELEKKYPQFKVIIHITMMKDNLEEIEPLIQFLEEKHLPNKIALVRGNSFSTFNVPLSIIDHKYEPKINQSVDVIDLERILRQIKLRFPGYFDHIQENKLDIMLNTLRFRQRQIPCYAGLKTGVIHADGDISICEQVIPFGNLSKWDWNINEAWKSTEAKNHRNSLTKCACLDGCNTIFSVSQNSNTDGAILWSEIK